MTNFELRKKLYKLLGEVIIYTNELHNRNLMHHTDGATSILSNIYRLLSYASVLSFVEKEIETDAFILEEFNFLEKRIENHFVYSFLTAKEVLVQLPSDDWDKKVDSFVELISEPKKEEPPVFSDNIF